MSVLHERERKHRTQPFRGNGELLAKLAGLGRLPTQGLSIDLSLWCVHVILPLSAWAVLVNLTNSSLRSIWDTILLKGDSKEGQN